jgi:hypothetical protein
MLFPYRAYRQGNRAEARVAINRPGCCPIQIVYGSIPVKLIGGGLSCKSDSVKLVEQ